MDTFDLLPPTAGGDLGETSAAELVAAIFRSRASGTLSLDSAEGVEIRQFFRAGSMCGSAFFAGFRTLAMVLLANDWVNALAIDASLAEAQAGGKRHGQVLVEKGLLTADQLKWALAAQHKQNLGALLALESGHYELRGWEPPPVWTRELAVDPVGPLVEAFSAPRLEPRRRRVIDWLGGSPVRLSVDWPEIAPRVELEAGERRAAALLTLPRSPAEFLRLSHLEPGRAEGLLVTLLLVGGVEPQPGSGAQAREVSAPPPFAPPPPYIPPQATPVYSPSTPPVYTPSTPPMYEAPAAREAAPAQRPAASAPAAPSWPPRAVAPPEPDALDLVPLEHEAPPPRPAGTPLFTPPGSRPARPTTPVRPATNPGYFVGAPQIPTTPLQQPSAPAPPRAVPEPPAPAAVVTTPHEARSLSAEELAVVEELARMAEVPAAAPGPDGADAPPGLRRGEAGFELAGSPEDPLPGMEVHAGRAPPSSIPPPTAADVRSDDLRKRMRARGMRNLRGQGGESTPIEQEVAAPAASQVDESLLSAEDRRLIEEVRARARVIGEQDAYARLGVSRTSGSDAIRAAYLEAAKRYHPDHAGAPGLSVVQEELKTVFSAMKEAYDLISTATLRQAYEQQLKAGAPGKAQTKKEEAAVALKMGEVLLKKRDFAAALTKLHRAVDLDPNGDALAALAWGLMCDPATSPAGKEEAAALINKALRAPGLSARTYYVAGVLWRTKDPDSAADAFRKALELEPNHADASLELRLLEMRQGRKQQGGGVLSGLLFGKKR